MQNFRAYQETSQVSQKGSQGQSSKKSIHSSCAKTKQSNTVTLSSAAYVADASVGSWHVRACGLIHLVWRKYLWDRLQWQCFCLLFLLWWCSWWWWTMSRWGSSSNMCARIGCRDWACQRQCQPHHCKELGGDLDLWLWQQLLLPCRNCHVRLLHGSHEMVKHAHISMKTQSD